MHLLQDRCPHAIEQTEDDEIEIDIDALEPTDLRYITKFVASRMEANS